MPRAAIGVAALIAVALGARVLPAAGQDRPPSACTISGHVGLSSKLACPNDPIEVRLHIRPSCPTPLGGGPVIRSLHVTHRLPSGTVPLAHDPSSGDPQIGVREWRLDVSADEGHVIARDGITLTHWLQPVEPGAYGLGEGATVRAVDSAGRLAEGRLTPSTLLVPAVCAPPRTATAYFPHVSRRHCAPPRAPADIVLMIDRSASIGASGLAAAVEGVRDLFDALDLSRDRVSVMAFDQRVSLLAPLGSERAVLEAALTTLRPAPGTRIERAIRGGTAELGGPRGAPGRRRVLVLVSDGVQTGPPVPGGVRGAAAEARAQRVRILPVAVGHAPDLALLGAVSARPGRVPAATTRADVAGAFAALTTHLRCAR